MHVGSARTALYNWLWAKHTGGELILRIEDTDVTPETAAKVEHYARQILESLDWLGITFDGEPVRQSANRERYDQAIDELLASDQAYFHDGTVKFRVPREALTEVSIDDLVRGTVRWATAEVDDFIIRRSDGRVMFTFANTIDDLALGITHVIRGEDLLNPTPKTRLLRAALAPDAPPLVYAHLPLLVGPDGKKLSKRRDAVAVDDFRDRGVLAEAMVNHLALLGWGPKDGIEIRPIDEIAQLFDLADVTASAARFDEKKLFAINAAYVRELSAAEFAAAAEPWTAETTWGAQMKPAERLAAVTELAPLVQQRTQQLSTVGDALAFAFTEPSFHATAWAEAEKAVASAAASETASEAANEAAGETGAATICAQAADALAALGDWSAEAIGDVLRAVGERHGLALRRSQMPVRVAVTGATIGPPLFESMAWLGQDKVLRRLRAAVISAG